LWRAIDQDDEAAALALVRAGGLDVQGAQCRGRHAAAPRGGKGDARARPSRCSRAAPRSMRAPRTARARCTSLRSTPTHRSPSCCSTPGADVNAQNNDGESVLMWAALSGHVAVAQRLLARGADANAKDRKGSLPLHAAADGGHLELARLLSCIAPRTRGPKNGAGKDRARLRPGANGYAQIEKAARRLRLAARRTVSAMRSRR
jgi:hypothetical protein